MATTRTLRSTSVKPRTEPLLAHLKNGSSSGQDLQHQPPRLLTIPRELRDEIYNHLLKPERNISINLFPYDEATRAFLSLSATCKQTQAEANDLFFKNTFVWSVCSIPHYSCESQLHRMKRLELKLDIKSPRSNIAIALTPQGLSIFWDQQMWTMPVTGGGKVQMDPFPRGLSDGRNVDLRHRYDLMQKFYFFIVQGCGVNIDALNVLGDELSEHGWRCLIIPKDQ